MTKFDKIVFAAFIISGLVWFFATFGVGGLAVVGAIIVAIAFIAALVWLNQVTGGAVGFILFFWSL